MADGYDLGFGLLQGLNRGIEAYSNTKEKELSRKQQQEELNAQLAAKGLLRSVDPVTGKVTYKKDPGLLSAEDDPLEKEILQGAAQGRILEKSPDGKGLLFKGYAPEYLKGQKEIYSAKGGEGKDIELEKKKLELQKAIEAAKNPGTEGERKAGGFGARIQQAENVFSELEKSGYDRSSAKEALKAKAGGLLPSSIKGAGTGKQEQAERNFINAVLRRESGAAISPDEFENAEQQYFPRYGDTPEVKEQKRLNRAQVLENIMSEAGPAAGKIKVVGPSTKALSAEDQQALEWANSNPKDPRAAAIKAKLGI